MNKDEQNKKMPLKFRNGAMQEKKYSLKVRDWPILT